MAAERRRILLAEIKPKVPQAKVYATWNPGKTSPNIALSNGNLTATAVPTNFGAVRATVGITAGHWYWELTYDTLPTTSYIMSGGIGRSDASLTDGQMGFHNSPIYTQGGPRTTTGDCYTASTLTGTVGTIAAGDVISFWLDADAGILRVRKNGGAWQKLGRRPSLTADEWFPMLQSARNGACTANFGASPFAYAVPDGVNAGVYSQADPVATTVYLGTEGFTTLPSDTPASTHYEGRIAADVDLVTEREAGCWVWGDQTRSSRGQLSIVSADGALSPWTQWIWRDAEVILYRGYAGDGRGDFVLRSKERVETMTLSKNRWTLTLADQLALLDVAVPRLMYSTRSANAQLVARASNLVFGRPLYCEGSLRDTTALGVDAFTFDQSDASVRVDAVYDRGDIFAAIPANWAATQDGLGFKLTNEPDEPVVANPAGPWKLAGSDTITGANGGDFTGWSGSPLVPTGWTQLGTAWTTTNRFQQWNTTECRLRATGSQMVQMYNSGTSLPEGNFRITLQIVTVTTPGVVAFFLGAEKYYVRIDRVGPLSIIVHSPGAQLQFIAGNDGTNALGAIDVSFVTMRARAATLIEHLADWTEYFTITLGGAAALDTGATTALEAEADYRLAHFAKSDETILSIMRRTMDGWCGWLIPKASGELTVGRLTRPADVADITLTDKEIKSVDLVMDTAKQLTTRLAGRRNHRVHGDSDIADSVSAALRAELKTEYTAIRSAQPTVTVLGNSASFTRRATVSSELVQADGAPPQPTFLQEGDDLQAEISRVASLARDGSQMFVVVAELDALIADSLEPGMTARVIWDDFELQSGRNFLFKRIRSAEFDREVTFVLWEPKP